jgi:hypothetical protein
LFRKVLEQFKLAERAKAEERVFEGQDALDGDLFAGGLVECGHDGAISALAE